MKLIFVVLLLASVAANASANSLFWNNEYGDFYWVDGYGNWVGGPWDNARGDSAYFYTHAGYVEFSDIIVRGILFGGNGFNLIGYDQDSTLQLANVGTGSLQPGEVYVENGVTASIGRSITGSVGLKKTAPGTLNLWTANTYSGATSVEAGKLVVSASGALGNSSVSITAGQLLFDLAGFSPNPTITVPNNIALPSVGSTQLTVSPTTSQSTVRLTGILSGGSPGEQFNLVDSGLAGIHRNVLALDNAANTFSGIIYMTRGTLAVTSDGALGNVTAIRHATGTTEGALRFDANNVTLNSSRTLELVTTGAVTPVNTQEFHATIAGTITGPGTLVKQGSGILTLSGATDWTGGTQVAAGTLQFSGNASAEYSGNIANDGTVDADRSAPFTLSGVLSGAGNLVQSGAAPLTLTNLNSFAGGVTVNKSTMFAAYDESLGAAGAPAVVNALGTLTYLNSTTVNRTITLDNGRLTAAAGAIVTLPSDSTFVTGVFGGPGAFATQAGQSTTFAAGTLAPSANLTLNGDDALYDYSQGGHLLIAPASTTSFSVVQNTSSGQITVEGTANVSDFTSNGQINIFSGGAIYNSGSPLALGGGSRTYIGTANAPGGTLDLGGNDLELNGGLLINNGTISGTVNVNYGSLAKGSGTYDVVYVSDGGVYAPGNSPGVSAATSVHFDNSPTVYGGPVLMIEIVGPEPGSQYDQLHVSDQLTLGGTLAVALLEEFAPSTGDVFDILDWGTLSGTFSSIQLPSLATGLQWNTSQLYTSGILSVVSPGLPGDYNDNGIVNAADYTVWRDNLGAAAGTLPNDIDGGTIGPAQFDTWKANFGSTSGAGALSSVTIPEPATLVLLLLTVPVVFCRRAAVS